MITLSRTLSGVLLATTALFAAQSAFAQTLPAAVADSAAPRDVQAADVEAAQTPAEDQAVPTTPDDETEVEAIVVRGRYIPEPMRATSEVASFLQAEDLERQGDDTAAAALTRVTGLSLVQGRFVYVRGLGERYSSALLNGSPLPSPEPLQRVVPLDLFPSLSLIHI